MFLRKYVLLLLLLGQQAVAVLYTRLSQKIL